MKIILRSSQSFNLLPAVYIFPEALAMALVGRAFNVRALCTAITGSADKLIRAALTERFPQSTIKVVDVSGGCGAMFEVFVESKEFVGLNTLKQHKLVTNALKEQIKEMHGVRIFTTAPKKT